MKELNQPAQTTPVSAPLTYASDLNRSAEANTMTPVAEKPFESASSKLAFTFACWGMLLPILFAVPAVILGHIGSKTDKMAPSRTKTAAVALIMGYSEVTLLITGIYFVWPWLSR